MYLVRSFEKDKRKGKWTFGTVSFMETGSLNPSQLRVCLKIVEYQQEQEKNSLFFYKK